MSALLQTDMARQEANQAFASTSFLYGANASWIEELYARFKEDPQSVDAEWRGYFEGLKDDKDTVMKEARGRLLGPAGLADPGEWRARQRA